MLTTLAFRLPREDVVDLLGSVTAYPLSEEFQRIWDQLPRRGTHRQPYSALATALTAATGQRVCLFGEWELGEDERARGNRMLLITDKALDHRFKPAVRAWERQVRSGAADAELADRLPPPEKARLLAEHVQYRPGAVPLAPGWVFRIATWQLMRRLAERPLALAGNRSQRLMIDTDGCLLAWDRADLLAGSRPGIFAMGRISAKLTTRGGVEDLIVTFDAHISRFTTDWAFTKNTWLYRGDDKPILRLPVRHRRTEDEWVTYLDPPIVKVLEACQTSGIEVGTELPPEPGAARPSTREFQRHDVGSGPGPRYMARLHAHVTNCLPQLRTLTYRQAKEISVPQRPSKSGLPDVDVSSTGFQRVLITCLYATTDAHQRMLGELRALADTDVSPVEGGPAVPVIEGVDVLIRHCPDLLRHGPGGRAALLESTMDWEPADDQLVVAWVETEYHPEVDIKQDDDKKPYLRRLLAQHGIPSQFLATDPAGVRQPRTKKQREAKVEAKAHAARSALRDLFRIAGATGRHLARPPGADENLLGREALLVGIHARRQQTADGEVPLVLTLVAVHACPEGSWSTLMASTTTQDWRTAARGITDFHGGSIGDPYLGRSEEKAARTRAHVDEMLRKLVTGDRVGIPVVLFVDTVATRSIWPGLRDQSLGDGALPGDRLVQDGHDVALVRLNDDIAEIGRPVDRLGGRRPADPDTPGSPGRKPKLYRLTESAQPLWLFPRLSRKLDSLAGRPSMNFTRWTLPAERKKELRASWHAYTATEILVVRAGGWEPAELAAITARLCEHPVSWDHRTSFPVPLHLAVGADRDHPSYRAAR
ncbi:RNaseH domain-containing protein [Amycolatopsis sp. lyj-346]|uniref:RNaseH domain-containing protein n=1 Tax=Amycolatopsis sp. lyj-346 TaxID=2789289 RepID=UPI00397E512E